MNDLIKKIIKPETDLELRIISDPRFVEGCLWGKPRNGHPEGEVINHIGDVLANVDKFSTPRNREKIRLIALIHDTFKYKVNLNFPKSGENHHGMIARHFAEEFISDKETLDIIQYHDDAYNSWRIGSNKNDWKRAADRGLQLINRLGDAIDDYVVFYRCDNKTGDKMGDDYLWFVDLIIRVYFI